MGQVFSDLNLDGDAPVRARPGVGEWGPQNVITTGQKKRQRVWAVLAFVLVLCLIIGLGAFWYHELMAAMSGSG
ncbi:MAG: hypothetical protein FWF75_02250 [Propionibacteriaceae bacterium]|nr:hypothetical protein [Propionibacteriaceae bacterium]